MEKNTNPANDKIKKEAPPFDEDNKKQKYQLDKERHENVADQPKHSREEKQPDGTVDNYEELEKERRQNPTSRKPKVDGVAGSE